MSCTVTGLSGELSGELAGELAGCGINFLGSDLNRASSIWWITQRYCSRNRVLCVNKCWLLERQQDRDASHTLGSHIRMGLRRRCGRGFARELWTTGLPQVFVYELCRRHRAGADVATFPVACWLLCCPSTTVCL